MTVGPHPSRPGWVDSPPRGSYNEKVSARFRRVSGMTPSRKGAGQARRLFGGSMRSALRLCLVVSCLVVASSPAWAQASLAGLVRDASGAVLPGVTVEAASPQLIEKVRTAITDGTGRYRIESLQPGDYTVT